MPELKKTNLLWKIITALFNLRYTWLCVVVLAHQGGKGFLCIAGKIKQQKSKALPHMQ